MIIGVVGRSGSGKTTLARRIEDLGFHRVSLDDLAKDLTPSLINQIAEVFGDRVVTLDGQLNRQALGKIVFSCLEDQEKLNQIFAEPLWKALQDLLRIHPQIVVEGFDLPWDFRPNLLIDVTAPFEILLERLRQREPQTQVEILISRLNMQMFLRLRKTIQADRVLSFDSHCQTYDDIIEQIKVMSAPRFSDIVKSLGQLKEFQKHLSKHLAQHKLTLEHMNTELLPDGSIKVHALVMEGTCSKYVHIPIEQGENNELKILPPVAPRD